MRRAHAGFALLLLAAWLPRAIAEEPTDSPLDALLARLRSHEHRRATFTERFSSHLLDAPLESRGELVYDAPDHLEKRTLAPRHERMVLDHGTLTLERRHRTLTTTLAAYPEAAPYIDSIRATLAGDRAGLERVFRVSYLGGAEAWTLSLEPRAAAHGSSGVRRIRIDGAAEEIRTVTIELGNGDSTRMTLDSARAG